MPIRRTFSRSRNAPHRLFSCVYVHHAWLHTTKIEVKNGPERARENKGNFYCNGERKRRALRERKVVQSWVTKMTEIVTREKFSEKSFSWWGKLQLLQNV